MSSIFKFLANLPLVLLLRIILITPEFVSLPERMFN